MKFDAENQHAEAFKCRGFDGYMSLDGDDAAAPVEGKTATKLGGLVAKGTEWAQSERGQKAIQGGKDLLALKRSISARRNPDEEVLSKCGKKPLIGKKKKEAWEKCRQETLAARAAALAAQNSSEETPPDNSGSVVQTPPDNSNVERSQRSVVQGGTPSKSQMPIDDKKTFDWKKNWWVLPLGLGVLYLGYTKFIKKK